MEWNGMGRGALCADGQGNFVDGWVKLGLSGYVIDVFNFFFNLFFSGPSSSN